MPLPRSHLEWKVWHTVAAPPQPPSTASCQETATSSRLEPPTGRDRDHRAKLSVLPCQDVSTRHCNSKYCICSKQFSSPVVIIVVHCQPAALSPSQKRKTAAGRATLLPNRILITTSRQRTETGHKHPPSRFPLAEVRGHSLRRGPFTASSLQ